jgi:hypothetical protein
MAASSQPRHMAEEKGKALAFHVQRSCSQKSAEDATNLTGEDEC